MQRKINKPNQESDNTMVPELAMVRHQDSTVSAPGRAAKHH